MNPFELFTNPNNPGSAITQVEGKDAEYYPSKSATGEPLNEYQKAWLLWHKTGVFSDPRDPKFLSSYPVKGQNGLWYQFNELGQLIFWTGGDPEEFIKKNPLPKPEKPSAEQVKRLFEACNFS